MNLPEIEFASKDVIKIETDVITTYEALSGRKLAPGDPVRLFLQAIAYLFAQQRVLIDYTGKQNLLAYAQDFNLDHKGVDMATGRLKPQPAKTIERFILSAPQPQAVTIPAGTRVTPGGQLFFIVENPINIPAGTTQVDVEFKCTTPGIVGNDWQVGQIDKLVDPLPWIQKVKNITVSVGGTEAEDDDSYRERIHQAPESLATTGPEGAYIYWAKTAHPSISDVAVDSPAPGEVAIYILLKDGEIPSEEIIDAVKNICSDKKKRPLTDYVTVLAPTIVGFDMNIEYFIDEEHTAEIVTIQTAINNAVENYITWQKSKLGRDINPTELIALIRNAGAKRVNVTAPVFTKIERNQVAIANKVTVNYGGLEDA